MAAMLAAHPMVACIGAARCSEPAAGSRCRGGGHQAGAAVVAVVSLSRGSQQRGGTRRARAARLAAAQRTTVRTNAIYAMEGGDKPPQLVVKAAAKASAAAGREVDVNDTPSELELPRETEAASSSAAAADDTEEPKPRAKTRLLRTPLSGGVVSSVLSDLPSTAVASRNLMEQADYADLSTKMCDMHHRRAGYPFGSTVDFATDASGHPIFCLHPLAIQTRNVHYDPRCSLTVKMSGWAGLANARVTIFGDVYRLPPEYQSVAKEIFKAKYRTRKEEGDLEDRWGDYTFYRMNNVIDVYFVGGFGTLNWVNLSDYFEAKADQIVTPNDNGSVLDTLDELNDLHGRSICKMLGDQCDDAWIISIDRRGMDVRLRVKGSSRVQRFNFGSCVETPEDAHEAVIAIITNESWDPGCFPLDD